MLVPKEEPKDEYGELEQIPASSFGAVSIKFGIEAGGVYENEPKVKLEEGEIQEPKAEYGELESGMGKQEMQGPSFGEGSLKREFKEEYSEFETESGGSLDVFKKEPKVELEEGDSGDVRDIIAGRERISFVVFKELVESGRLTREDLSVMRNARVIEVPGEGELVQFLSLPRYHDIQQD